jgi:hypothetical protein
LTKNRKQRLQAIDEARIVLERAGKESTEDGVTAPGPEGTPSRLSYVGWIGTVVFALLAAIMSLLHFREKLAATPLLTASPSRRQKAARWGNTLRSLRTAIASHSSSAGREAPACGCDRWTRWNAIRWSEPRVRMVFPSGPTTAETLRSGLAGSSRESMHPGGRPRLCAKFQSATCGDFGLLKTRLAPRQACTKSRPAGEPPQP